MEARGKKETGETTDTDANDWVEWSTSEIREMMEMRKTRGTRKAGHVKTLGQSIKRDWDDKNRQQRQGTLTVYRGDATDTRTYTTTLYICTYLFLKKTQHCQDYFTRT